MTVASHCSGKFMAPNYYSIKHIWPLNIIQCIMWAWITIRGKFVLCHSLSTPRCQIVVHFNQTLEKKRNPSLYSHYLLFSYTGHLDGTIQWVPVTCNNFNLKIKTCCSYYVLCLFISANSDLTLSSSCLCLFVWVCLVVYCLFTVLKYLTGKAAENLAFVIRLQSKELRNQPQRFWEWWCYTQAINWKHFPITRYTNLSAEHGFRKFFLRTKSYADEVRMSHRVRKMWLSWSKETNVSCHCEVWITVYSKPVTELQSQHLHLKVRKPLLNITEHLL